MKLMFVRVPFIFVQLLASYLHVEKYPLRKAVDFTNTTRGQMRRSLRSDARTHVP